jgi:hypothetical protein
VKLHPFFFLCAYCGGSAGAAQEIRVTAAAFSRNRYGKGAKTTNETKSIGALLSGHAPMQRSFQSKAVIALAQ